MNRTFCDEKWSAWNSFVCLASENSKWWFILTSKRQRWEISVLNNFSQANFKTRDICGIYFLQRIKAKKRCWKNSLMFRTICLPRIFWKFKYQGTSGIACRKKLIRILNENLFKNKTKNWEKINATAIVNKLIKNAKGCLTGNCKIATECCKKFRVIMNLCVNLFLTPEGKKQIFFLYTQNI